MDPIANPFAPGAGTRPPELAGRDPVIQQARILLGRVKFKRPEKSMLLTGLRGVGKTVLLNEIEGIARDEGYSTVSIEADENKPLVQFIAPSMRGLLFQLDRIAGTGDKVKRAFAVLRSFIGALKVSVGGIEIAVEPEKGTADSGDLEMDLPALFVAVGEAAEDRGSGVAVLIDEIQYFAAEELSALVVAMHKVQQRRLPVVLIGAGLPTMPGVVGDARSYSERLFSFPQIGALSEADAEKALQDPATAAGIAFDDESLDEIYRLTNGYPYFIQEWGSQCWNLATSSPITKQVVENATEVVIKRLDEEFFHVRFAGLLQRVV